MVQHIRRDIEDNVVYADQKSIFGGRYVRLDEISSHLNRPLPAQYANVVSCAHQRCQRNLQQMQGINDCLKFRLAGRKTTEDP